MRGRLNRVALGIAFLLVLPLISAAAGPLRLVLPTRNDALFGNQEEFFQYTDRYYRGVKTYPWEGGQYGFVRNLKDTPAGTVYARFHEGLDIKPVYLDENEEPLDTVVTIDDGRIVYVNRLAEMSNYGKYVVVEHIWDDAPYYSLYAHLGEASVWQGQRVRRGDPLGIMGYTGEGISKRRAHVHFEINLLLNEDYPRWYETTSIRSRNPHGRYNGQNMTGIDVASLYRELRGNPELTITEFLRRQKPYFEVTVPNRYAPDLLYRYSWMTRAGYDAKAPSYLISFTQNGMPIRIEPSSRRVDAPQVTYAQASDYRYDLNTNHLLSGSNRWDAELTTSGQRYLSMILYPGSQARAGVRPPPPVVEVAPLAVKPPEYLANALPGLALRYLPGSSVAEWLGSNMRRGMTLHVEPNQQAY